jgi:hypothetical protein
MDRSAVNELANYSLKTEPQTEEPTRLVLVVFIIQLETWTRTHKPNEYAMFFRSSHPFPAW